MSEESERVKKFKRKKMNEGYKNISFMVSPEEFKMIEDARKVNRMSTRELLIYFVSGQHSRDMFKHEEIGSLSWTTHEDRIQSLKKEEKYGDAFNIPNKRKKKYLLVYFKSINNSNYKIIRGFDTTEEANDYVNNRYFSKKRIVLLFKVPDVEDWYWIRQVW